METITEYLAMGGYASYVWPAFGIAALVMAGLVAASRRALRQREADLKSLQHSRAETAATGRTDEA